MNRPKVTSKMNEITRYALLKARKFNNKGAAIFVYNPEAGWTLFKGALEITLAVQRSLSSANEGIFSESLATIFFCGYVQNAERLMKKVEGYYRQGKDHFQAKIMSTTSTGVEMNEPTEPGIYNKAISVPKSSPVPVLSGTIIFNLALAEHMADPKSPRIPQLYELASMSMHEMENQRQPGLLSIAIVNNTAMYYLQNGDLKSARTIIAQIFHILSKVDSNDRPYAENPELQIMVDNVILLLMPKLTASRAA